MVLALRIFRILALTLALVFVAGIGAGWAQQPSGSNPTAESVREGALMQELDRLQGRVSIPDAKLSVLQQPQGRDYRAFHEGMLPWIGAVIILGMLLLLALFYFWRGTLRMPSGRETGRTILRYNVFERFNHWMTATCFIVLAITGLNYFLGKRLLMPLLGADAFSTWSIGAKYAHNFLAWPFMLGLLFMILVWLRDNLPDRYDWAWLKAGGGMLGNAQPTAARFNAGQKMIFWAVVIGGIALSVTGIVMLFPFSLADVNGMQIAQYIHSIVGVILIAVILAHIYIGTIGVAGAFRAMESGEVDLAWARHHHRAWVEEQEKALGGPPAGKGAAAPAE